MTLANNIAFDNGKIRISVLDDIPLVEIYHTGELGLADVEWASIVILHELGLPPHQPVTSIINRIGSYSLSAEAVTSMEVLMKNARYVAYVSQSPMQESLVEFASKLYLSGRRVADFRTVQDAHEWIKENLNSDPV